MNKTYDYPCTRYIDLAGFGAYLEQESRGVRMNINKFTQELRTRFGIPYLTLVNSGSSANLVAALAMAEKVKQAGRPMTAAISAFTFPTTVSALLLAGFRLVLVDVEEGGFNLSLRKLQESKEEFGLIAPTHFLGFPCDLTGLRHYADERHCFILQDACETFGMRVGDKQAFLYGDISTWSFYHPHHLSSFGGGGVISLSQEDALLIDSIAHWGRACRCHTDESLCRVPAGPAHQFTYERLGVNVEISELNACFGRWMLRRWESMEQCRLGNYAILLDTLRDLPSIRVWEAPDISCSPFVFPIHMLNGMTVTDACKHLSREGIEIRTLMGGAANEQAAYRKQLGEEIRQHAHHMAETCFFVGIHHTLPAADVRHVAQRLRALFSAPPEPS